MAEGMTAKGVAAKKNDVNGEHDCSDANSEGFATSRRIAKPQRLPNVDREDDNKNEREIKEIAMDVLHNKRKRTLAQIRRSRFAHAAGGGIGPKSLVIGASIIIAGKPESTGRPQDQECGRK